MRALTYVVRLYILKRQGNSIRLLIFYQVGYMRIPITGKY